MFLIRFFILIYISTTFDKNIFLNYLFFVSIWVSFNYFYFYDSKRNEECIGFYVKYFALFFFYS